MNVKIDKYSGFCWGVVRTIAIAESILKENKSLFSLGEVIHNPNEIKRLSNLGLNYIKESDLEIINSDNSKILIRAHGAPPEIYKKSKELGLELIDATCPVVTKLQERIKKYHDSGFQIVIFGKKEHAEVIGLRGVTNDTCIVIKSVEEALTKVDFSKNTVLFSQTTMDKPTFYIIKKSLEAKIGKFIVESSENIAVEFHSKDTICGQVSGRDKRLREFAKENDLILFVAGRLSSNGKVLYDICKESNQNSHFIEDVSELKDEWFCNVNTVGISGATSTPQWLMEQIKSFIEAGYQ